MGGQIDRPKQYLEIGGKAIIAHTIEAFVSHPQIAQVQPVIHRDDAQWYDNAVMNLPKLRPPVIGGANRQESVFIGLKALDGQAKRVLVHDAVRPGSDHGLISRVIDAVGPGNAVMPALPVADTLRRMTKGSDHAAEIDRNDLWRAQTPQGFELAALFAAHKRAAELGKTGFTDDVAIGAWDGLKVIAVAGSEQNMKITTADDLVRAQIMFGAFLAPDIRTGHGFDVHAFVTGDAVMLCGLRIAHDQALGGHSDADVGLHAATDALLGAIGAGDIGSHFPPSDPKWKGANSATFLVHAAELVRKTGGQINHLDITLVCEAPKIGPHRQAMRARVAEIVGIDISRVSVKATTTEGLGFTGRREGIAAQASATVVIGALSGVGHGR